MTRLKEKMTSCQSFAAASIFLFVLFVLFFLSLVGREWIEWFKSNYELASWVQAIGAILAIVFAGHQVGRQIKAAKYHQEIIRSIEENKYVHSYIEATEDAAQLLELIAREFTHLRENRILDFRDQVEFRISVYQNLISHKTHQYSIAPFINVISELMNVKICINEYENLKKTQDRRGMPIWILNQSIKLQESLEQVRAMQKRLSQIYSQIPMPQPD